MTQQLNPPEIESFMCPFPIGIFIDFHVKYEHKNKHNFLNVLKLLF